MGSLKPHLSALLLTNMWLWYGAGSAHRLASLGAALQCAGGWRRRGSGMEAILLTACKPWCRFAAAVDALESGAGDSEWGDLSFCNLHLAGTDAKSRKVGPCSHLSAVTGAA